MHTTILVGVAGFDPAASGSPNRRSTWLSYTPLSIGLGCTARTCDPRIPNAVRYQLR